MARRSWMPVRVTIHSWLVATRFSISAFVRQVEGTAVPVPTIRAPMCDPFLYAERIRPGEKSCPLLSPAAERQTDVGAAKTERIREGNTNGCPARGIRHIVQVALRVRLFVVDRGREALVV